MLFFLSAVVADTPPITPSHKRKELLGIFRADDYPADAQRAGQQGTVIARLVVNPAGRVESCAVVYSSKSQSLDAATCKILSARTRFTPAQDERGNPIYNVVITPPVTWRLDYGGGVWVGNKVTPKQDVELQISSAPPAVTLPLDFSVDYEVKADGSLGYCRAAAEDKVPAAFAEVACDRSNMPHFQPLRNKDGQLVDAMYRATYRFSLDH